MRKALDQEHGDVCYTSELYYTAEEDFTELNLTPEKPMTQCLPAADNIKKPQSWHCKAG